jgi:tetratricopeptide (TPR) repeat protein
MKNDAITRKENILLLIVLCSVGFIIYSNALGGAFQLDDHIVITDNPVIRNLANLPDIWQYWPTRFITNLSFALNYRFGHLNVFMYHLLNLLIHILASILVWRITFFTFLTPVMKDERIAGHKESIAFFAGLLFVSHPIQTEAVSYIVQRATCLAALFCLTALYFYLKSRLSEIESGPSKICKYYYVISMAAALVAMFTKETAIILPAIILLYEVSFFKGKQALYWKRLILFFVTLPVIPITMLVTRSVNFSAMCRVSEGSSGISPLSYLLTQLKVMFTYIKLIFIPINQNIDYDYHAVNAMTELPVLASLIFLILILLLAVKMFSRYRLMSFGVFWFFLTLLPESSVIPIADLIFEHRLYLPAAGYSMFLAGFVYYIFGRKSVRAMNMAMICLIVFYAAMAYNRNFVWQSEFSLWDDAVRKSPNKSRTYNNRGYAYMKKSEFDLAIKDFDRAIQLDPGLDPGYYYNRGNAYNLKGSLDKAISDYTKAIEMQPDYVAAYVNRAIAHFKNKDYDNNRLDVRKAESLGYRFDRKGEL